MRISSILDAAPECVRDSDRSDFRGSPEGAGEALPQWNSDSKAAPQWKRVPLSGFLSLAGNAEMERAFPGRAVPSRSKRPCSGSGIIALMRTPSADCEGGSTQLRLRSRRRAETGRVKCIVKGMRLSGLQQDLGECLDGEHQSRVAWHLVLTDELEVAAPSPLQHCAESISRPAHRDRYSRSGKHIRERRYGVFCVGYCVPDLACELIVRGSLQAEGIMSWRPVSSLKLADVPLSRPPKLNS